MALLPARGHNVPPQRVAGELKSGPGRVANADAEVIRAYLAAVGIAVDAARLNLLLALLGVVLLECGAGLMALLSAMALPVVWRMQQRQPTKWPKILELHCPSFCLANCD